jgi:hypothetical protein
MNIDHWWNIIDRGNLKYSDRNQSQCNLVCQNYHAYWLEIDPGTPRREAGDLRPDPRHNLFLF